MIVYVQYRMHCVGCLKSIWSFPQGEFYTQTNATAVHIVERCALGNISEIILRSYVRTFICPFRLWRTSAFEIRSAAGGDLGIAPDNNTDFDKNTFFHTTSSLQTLLRWRFGLLVYCKLFFTAATAQIWSRYCSLNYCCVIR